MKSLGRQPALPADAITVTAYEELDLYVGKVVDRALDLLLIIGRHGTGKSEQVRKMLDVDTAGERGVLYVEGHAQPFGIYHGLWLHRDRPVVLDDVDKLYANPDCVRILKLLCDTRPVKRISWLTNATVNGIGPPPAFETTSPVILIANEWRTLNANVRSLEDRAIIVHFDPSNESVHRRAGTWCEDMEVYTFIGAHLASVPAVSMRWYAKAQKLREAGFSEWRTLLLQMMLADRDLAVVASLLVDTAFHNDQQRVGAFNDRTGKSRATYYRLKKRLAASFKTVRLTNGVASDSVGE